MTNWSLNPIFESYLAVTMVILALAVLVLVSPNFVRVSRKRHAVLIALRCVVILLLALVMLRPTRVSTIQRVERASLLVLLDQSRSMQLPNATDSVSRYEAQLSSLRAADGTLREITDRIDVKMFAYDERLVERDWREGYGDWPQKPTGTVTDIGSNLHAAVRQELGKRLAGVILMGDGVQTALEPSVETQAAARELQRLGYPLFPILFGPPGNAQQTRDVAIDSMPDLFTVFVKNEVAIRGVVRASGYVNQEIPVELVIDQPDGPSQVIGQKKIVPREDQQPVEVVFAYTPQEVGQYRLTLRAAVQAGEMVTQNNALTAYLSVLEGGLRVLYLEGQLRHEQRFINRVLDSSPDLALDFQWFDARQRGRWPVTLDESLTQSNYDVLILGDLDSTALGDKNLTDIAAAVRRGRGLIMLGGYHSFGPGGYQTTPLAAALPVQMDRLERQDFGQPLRADLHRVGPLVIRPTREHPTTRLAPGPDNATRWATLPPLDGANKFMEVKDAAGVQVLLETTGGAPLLVSGEYGAGRVLAFAGDSTWRWSMRGYAADHKRFWRQVILWLARRDENERNEVWLKLPQRRFVPQSRVVFQAGAKSAAGDPLPAATLTAHWIGPDGQRHPLRLSREGDAWQGQIDAVMLPGDYQIELQASEGERQIGSARTNFHVLDQDLELANSAADHDQMQRLAQLTADFGGRVVAAEDLAQLLQELHTQSAEWEVPVQTRWQLTDTATDTWLVFLALLLPLATEWALRKRWGLV
ncbi:MAG: glutamine amidotransferase [Planctomycetota bacterium]